MVDGGNIENPGFGMATKGQRIIYSSIELLSIGDGGRSQFPKNFKLQGSTSDGLKCSHYGGSKHTKDTCFKLHGYLDWWAEFQVQQKRDGVGSFKANSSTGFEQINTSSAKAAVAAMEPIFSTARQQPLGLKNGTLEKENNRETGDVFPIEGTCIIGTTLCFSSTITSNDA